MTEVLLVGVATLAAGLWIGWWARARRASNGQLDDLEQTRSELTRRLSELFSFQELSYVLAESIEPDRVAEQVAQYVARFIECDGTLVALVGDRNAPGRVAAAQGSLSGLVGHETGGVADTGLVATAMRSAHLEVVAPDGGEPEVILGDVQARQAVAVPLRAHGVTVGAVVALRNTGPSFSEAELRLLSTVATHSAVALANGRFVELIRAGKQQWETTFDTLAEGIAVVDGQGCVQRANRALASLLGKPLPEVIGTNLREVLLGHSPELAELLDAAHAGEQRPPLTRRSDPLNSILRVTASPMREDVGGRWVVALIEDVTEQKALEAQLIQSEKMAAVGQLVSGVAHELNNPLTSISGLSEFLIERPTTNERDREHLKVVRDQAERAARIVRNLLAFARKGSTDVADVDLNHVVQRAASLMRYELRLCKITLEFELAEDLPPIRGDPYQIQQVVLNLLTNAVQAVSENPPERPRLVHVSSAVETGQVVLRLRDTGPGIPHDLIPKVFDPFFTTKDPGQGTGLGLSITFGIVERHGGQIQVESRAEGGAVFKVILPAVQPARA